MQQQQHQHQHQQQQQQPGLNLQNLTDAQVAQVVSGHIGRLLVVCKAEVDAAQLKLPEVKLHRI